MFWFIFIIIMCNQQANKYHHYLFCGTQCDRQQKRRKSSDFYYELVNIQAHIQPNCILQKEAQKRNHTHDILPVSLCHGLSLQVSLFEQTQVSEMSKIRLDPLRDGC